MKISNKIRFVKSDNNVSIIRLCFPSKLDKDENKNILAILSYILVTSCEKIPDYTQFHDHLKELCILDFSFDYCISFGTLYIYLELQIPNKGVFNEFNLEDAFSFFIDAITKPYAKDGEFNVDKFNYEKDYIYDKHKTRISRFYYECANRFFQIIDPDDILEDDYYKKLEKIEKITSKEAYEFYKKHVLESDFLTFILGNYDKKEIYDLFDKYYPIKDNLINVPKKKFNLFPIKKIGNVVETNPSNQSIYYIQYKVKNLKKEDKDYFDVLEDFINSKKENSLFDLLRIKNSKIYSIGCMSFILRGFFVLDFSISNVNKESVDKLLNEFWDSLKDKEFLFKIYKETLEEYKILYLKSQDGEFYNFDNKFNSTLQFSTLKKGIKFHEKLDIDKFSDFISRIEVANTYYLKGDQDE